MGKKTSRKDGRRRIWWWPFIIGIAAGLVGYFWMADLNHRGPEKAPSVGKETPATEQQVAVNGAREEAGKGLTPETGKTAEPESAQPIDPCAQNERDVKEFFQYLNQKNYVRHLLPDEDAYARFKEIMLQLSANPPIPAGEGVSPKMIAGNVYHLFRVLNRKDVRLVREVIAHEQDAMEIHLENFYRWLTAGASCPDPENLRPSQDVAYDYAGFFLGTIGGRAYLFRRPTELRLLVTYYAIRIVHDADKKGKNHYGIDVLPLIPPLLKEISHYPDFQHQDRYIRELNGILSEYKENRK